MDSSVVPTDPEGEPRAPGAIRVRSNIANRVDLSLVPGEFLNEYDPHYFDTRHHPPEQQVRERLYYEACARCDRASNDPACQC